MAGTNMPAGVYLAYNATFRALMLTRALAEYYPEEGGIMTAERMNGSTRRRMDRCDFSSKIKTRALIKTPAPQQTLQIRHPQTPLSQ
jgi:hypothetical protein